MTFTEEFTLPSRLESVEEAAGKAEAFARRCELSDDFVSAVDMAIREAVANAVKHGNKLDESKSVSVRLSVNGGTLEIEVADQGSGFSPEDVPDPTDTENLLKANGRGILFMRAFMDDVEWQNAPGGGMVVRMSKKQQN